jgi:type II secretory pathway component PulM
VKERFAALSPRTVLILAAVGVLLYAAVAWLLFVTPKRSETSRLGEDVAAAQVQLVQARAAAQRPGRTGAPVSDVFRLTKAMPSSGEQPGLVLELTRLATSTGVDLRSISLQPALEGAGGATMIPVVVVLGGTYRNVTA